MIIIPNIEDWQQDGDIIYHIIDVKDELETTCVWCRCFEERKTMHYKPCCKSLK